jgi:hypothetical protein
MSWRHEGKNRQKILSEWQSAACVLETGPVIAALAASYPVTRDFVRRG